MARSDRTRSAIIDYWRSVELFSPPAIDKVDHRKRMFRAEVAAPLPWESEHALAQVALKPHQVWQHSVYLGCYRLEHVTDVIKEIFGEDEGSYDGRLGESALAAIVVDEDGSYVDGSFILSSCAWGTGQLLMSVSSLDLDEFHREQAALGELVARLLTPPAVPENGEQPTEPVRNEAVCAVRDMVARHLGVTDRLAAQEIRIKSVLTSRRRPADTADDFLNSFLLRTEGDGVTHRSGKPPADRRWPATNARRRSHRVSGANPQAEASGSREACPSLDD